MAAKKLSIALEASTAKAAVASAREEGMSLSAWLNRAAERALRVRDGLRAVSEWEAAHGSLLAEELLAARARLDEKPPARRRSR